VAALACTSFVKYFDCMSAKPSLPKDPVADAIASAPVATQPISEEERRLIDEGRAAIAAGKVVTQEDVEARLAEKRRHKKGT
jgi:predicted transcriptional regulator